MAKLPVPRTPDAVDYLKAKLQARRAGEDTTSIDRAYAAFKSRNGVPADSNGATP
jgi:hypothetical protein